MNIVAVMGMVGLAVLGLLVGWWLGRMSVSASLAASQQHAKDLESRNTQQEGEIQGLRETQTAMEKEKARSEERLTAAQQSLAEERASFAQLKNDMKDAFKSLAGDALKDSNSQFFDLAHNQFNARQQAIDALLQPVKEKLIELSTQTQDLESKREGAYSALAQQLLQLENDQQGLRQAATALSSALRDTRITGKWGEIALHRVVELAGMTEHCDYTQQHTQEDNRPDLVVRLPNGRTIIVDAKTSIGSFVDAADAQDDAVRQQKLKEHAKNIRAHAIGLAKRRYEKAFEDAIDMTICFIPGDVYYYAAQQMDPKLFEDAANEKVVFATPSSLIILLKAAAFGWQQDSLRREANEILKQAQAVYDRLTTATGHLTGLGNSLNKSFDCYDKLLGSLERSVFPAARRMKELGINGDALPSIQPINKTVRPLQAPDWQIAEKSEALALAASEEKPEE